jgi:site-specific recombinase XerD
MLSASEKNGIKQTKFGNLLSHHTMKVNSNMSVLFWLYTKKADDFGKAPIYCRITLSGIRTQFSTAKKIEPEYWISEGSKVDKKSPDAAAINEDLECIKGDLRKVYNQLTATHKHVTGEMVKNAYTGKGQEKKTLMDVFNINIALCKEAVKKEKAALKTLQRLENIHRKIQAFLKKEYHLSDKPLVELKPSLGDDLKYYFTIDCNIGDNTSFKYISIVKELLDFAEGKGWLERNPIKNYRCPYKNPHREVLNMIEIGMLMDAKMPNKMVERVRDCYIFSCFTGYAYKEVDSLTKDNIVIGMDGNKWISLSRHKTDEPELVPLLPIPLEIIERYKNDVWANAHNKLLPVRSNQKYNKNLKKVAEVAGIKKHLTTHTARHTFATTVALEHDVPMETVSRLLGHRSIRTTQIYAKVSLKKLSNNMNDLREKLKGKSNLAQKVS